MGDNMDTSIRKNIINNFVNTTVEEITESINDSVNDQDEAILPGLGVFFEILWSKADFQLKDNIVNIIKDNLK